MTQIKTTIILTSIFLVINLSGQSTWITDIPYETYDGLSAVRDLTKTNDGGFMVLLNKVVEEDFHTYYHSMYKYSSDGAFEWEKHFDFGVDSPGPIYGGANPVQIIQLQNDNYLSTGFYVDSDTTIFYSLITNVNGDSLFYNQMTGLGSLNYVNEQIFAFGNGDLGDKNIYELSETGQIIDQTPLDDSEMTRMRIDGTGNIFTSYQIVPQKIQKFNEEGELVNQIILSNEFRSDLLSLNEENGVTLFRKDLIKLDANLNEIWIVPFEEIFPNSNGFSFNGKDIIHTEDQGYMLVGNRCGGFLPCQVYLLKYDLDGSWEWGGVYSSSLPLDVIHKVVEVADGYVFVGAHETYAKIRLIKLNKQGFLNNVATLKEDTNPKVALYPNPNSGVFTIECKSDEMSFVKITTMTGNTIYSSEFYNTLFISDIFFQKGIYFLELYHLNTGNISVRKIIIE